MTGMQLVGGAFFIELFVVGYLQAVCWLFTAACTAGQTVCCHTVLVQYLELVYDGALSPGLCSPFISRFNFFQCVEMLIGYTLIVYFL